MVYALSTSEGGKTEASVAASLQRINLAISTTLDLQEVLHRIVDEIVALFHAQSASVILYDHKTDEAHLTTTYGQDATTGTLHIRSPDRWLAGWPPIVSHCELFALRRRNGLSRGVWPS